MTVSELNLKAKSLLEAHFDDIALSGEISKITLHNSGHWYFELKDEKASLACAMFKGANSRVNFKPQVGDLVDLVGFVSLYEASGRFQFIAKELKKAGAGDLEAKFLALKERLEKEGLFDNAHKKQIPTHPEKVGIITSFTSAALQDMMKLISQKECFLAKFFIFNALTQGASAPNSLIKALQKADLMGLDFIIIARGGGSREDLFCFNDEGLARAIYNAKTPIISAIGHEIDYVISDFVADLRAPTPSAAIDMCFLSKNDLAQSLDLLDDKFKNLMQNKLSSLQNELNSLQKLLKANSLSKIISEKLTHLGFLCHNFELSLSAKFEQGALKLKQCEQAFSQHAHFFEKSKAFVSLKKDGKTVLLEHLHKDDIITLHSQNLSKEAKIL